MLRMMVTLFLSACATSAEIAPPQAPATPETVEDAGRIEDGWRVFGDTFSPADAIPLADAIAKGEDLVGQTVTVEGNVSEVCQKAGCWMVLSNDENHIRIRMKDHAFAVDKNGAGAQGQVQGEWIARAVPEAEVSHYAEETREGGVVPERNTQGRSFEIVAHAVKLAAR
jgi:hypothetical protein